MLKIPVFIPPAQIQDHSNANGSSQDGASLFIFRGVVLRPAFVRVKIRMTNLNKDTKRVLFLLRICLMFV